VLSRRTIHRRKRAGLDTLLKRQPAGPDDALFPHAPHSLQAVADLGLDRATFIAWWSETVHEVALLAHQYPLNADVVEPLRQVGGSVGVPPACGSKGDALGLRSKTCQW